MHYHSAKMPLRKRLILLIVALLALPLALAQDRPPTPGEIQLRLEKLNVLGSVMMIAAHPDDENTALLAYFALGRKMETAYLSATRGEGGQNLIGPEQGDELGVIRTQELLAARRIDGAQQFFTSAVDFGYSKTAEETLRVWGREKILGDMVTVIRRFQPDVIILRFSGTPRDGHGHHQSSAILGKEAFSAAADSSRFPGKPWQARRLMFNLFSFSRQMEQEAAATAGRLSIDAGQYDPLLGHSYAEIAGISRSQHRCQGMGAAQRKGPMPNFLVVIDGEKAAGDPFDGIDTTWNRVPGGAAVGPILARAAKDFSPTAPYKTIPALLEARAIIRKLDHPWAKTKLDELDEAIAMCSGLWLDVTADRYQAVPGSAVAVTLTAVNRSPFALTWDGKKLDPNVVQTQKVTWNVPPAHPYTQPFWLRNPREFHDGSPEGAPVYSAEFPIGAGTETIRFRRPLHFRYVDPQHGEETRPVEVVPAVAVNLPEDVYLFPDSKPRKVSVQIHASRDSVSGALRLQAQAGWQITPASHAFQLAKAGDQSELVFEITPPSASGEIELKAIATVDGREISHGVQVIAYSHIPPQTLFPEARATLRRADVRVLSKRIGYIMGAGDEIPKALQQIGCEVTLLGPEDLAQRDLSSFDAIVAGVRAYNTRPDLRANQQRLLEYVHSGGTYVVQYNVPSRGPFGGRDEGHLARLGPYPLTIGSARVSVEDAPLTVLKPDQPLLREPNQITPQDFSGWIQERGLYFASKWDPQYDAPLGTHDPGEEMQPGGLLFARYGKGAYVLTTYSWFRQLPAGVPGAYRIFANLISAGKAKEAHDAQ